MLLPLALPVALTLAVAPSHAAPPVERLQTTFGEMAYWDTGAGGPAIVLVHGLPTSKELWADVVPALALDHRVIALDINNFGDSEQIGRILDHRQRAAAIDELRVQLGLDDFVLVAHDLGASVAIDYMDLYGARVQRLVLLSSPVYPDFVEPRPVRLLRRPILGRALLRTMPRTLFRVAMRTGLHHDERLTREQVDAFASFYRGRAGAQALYENLWWGRPDEAFARYPALMERLEAPTLLLHGERDPWIPVEHVHRMHADIPNSELILIPDGGHFLPLDTPAAVARAVLSFIEAGPESEREAGPDSEREAEPD